MEKTVKVRIAVAVDPEGNWGCAGWKNADQDELHSYAVENLENGEHRYWLDAEFKIPEIPEISATVSSTEVDHPVTPPPELVKQWWDGTHGAYYEFEAITIQAARWGANQELQACCEWLSRVRGPMEITGVDDPFLVSNSLRTARRPEPKGEDSLVNQARQQISSLEQHGALACNVNILHQALNRLQELEGK